MQKKLEKNITGEKLNEMLNIKSGKEIDSPLVFQQFMESLSEFDQTSVDTILQEVPELNAKLETFFKTCIDTIIDYEPEIMLLLLEMALETRTYMEISKKEKTLSLGGFLVEEMAWLSRPDRVKYKNPNKNSGTETISVFQALKNINRENENEAEVKKGYYKLVDEMEFVDHFPSEEEILMEEIELIKEYLEEDRGDSEDLEEIEETIKDMLQLEKNFLN